MNDIKGYYAEEDINFSDILETFWKDRLPILCLTTLFAIFAIFYSLSLPDIYTSKAVLTPSEDQQSYSLGVNRSLANFVGNSVSSNSKSTVAIGKANSFSFFQNNILPNAQLEDLMAVKSWEPAKNITIYNSNVYIDETKTWINKPSVQNTYKQFKKNLSVTQDLKTGFVTVSYKHKSPYVAEELVELVVNEINNFFREKDRKEAANAMIYLQSKLQETNFAEIKEVIAELIQQKTQQLTLIEVTDYYVFEYIDPAIAPELKSDPSRSVITIMITLLGFVIAIFISLFRLFMSSPKEFE